MLRIMNEFIEVTGGTSTALCVHNTFWAFCLISGGIFTHNTNCE